MSKPSLVIAIIEDDHQKMLVYRYLIKRGFEGRRIRIRRSPSGRGSAENWVRKTWVEDVKAYRRRHAQTALVVMIDADTSTVQHRLTQLDHALTDIGEETVTEVEQIARLVPKRNVETWILCLNQTQVNETRDYKGDRDDWNELIPAAAQRLCDWVRSQHELPALCIDSVRTGVRELRRLQLEA